MHILLISACEKRAVKRSRAILDSYALRVGERTWATPITLEGMQALRALLKEGATRQTAVACYKNEGRGRMRLLWIVGSSRPFGDGGQFAAGLLRVRRAPSSPSALWLRHLGLLAQLAGLVHDLGKYGNIFQEKLARAVAHCGSRGQATSPLPEADPIRHEWISMRLLQLRRGGAPWADAWSQLTRPVPLEKLGDLESEGIRTVWDALDFAVVTHHRLFAPRRGASQPLPDAHVRDSNAARGLGPTEALPKDIDARIEKLVARLAKLAADHGPLYWQGLAILARAALILADHAVSAQVVGADATAGAYANTCWVESPGEPRRQGFNQPLCWHLRQVGERAADFSWKLANLRLGGLCPDTVERVLIPADEAGRFAWQNRAVDLVRNFASGDADGAEGLLIFNVAATGAGKTLANGKMATALRTRPRFAIALNLRSLTLQTGDALAANMGLTGDELATVIGDRVVARLHGDPPAFLSGTQGDGEATDLEQDFDVVGMGGAGGGLLPPWLDAVVRERPSLGAILSAPVLVSTIDYLISAGEPGAQGHHAGALARLVDSDLILDEVDAYEPEALVAVLRLVRMAAFLGRHVICASATLPVPVALAVFRAFQGGARLRAALLDRVPRCHVAVVDDQLSPWLCSVDGGQQGVEEFSQRFTAHQMALCGMPRPSFRRAWIEPVSGPGEGAFMDAVTAAVIRLHRAHAWATGVAPGQGAQRLSLGLVRVANIRTAIATARHLAVSLRETFPDVRVACYHARAFRIARHLQERRLDGLLRRHRGSDHILKDAEIAGWIAASTSADLPLIVVASPVEEIGRDHDFDWAVLEPSSAHSLVQCAGRVNRHRLAVVTEPNLAILQFNARWARNLGSGRETAKGPYFLRPGLEAVVGAGEGYRYRSADMEVLLEGANLSAVDASLRLGNCAMAQDEDQMLTRRLRAPLDILNGEGGRQSEWMTQAFYRSYRLRDGVPNCRWRAQQTLAGWEFATQSWQIGGEAPWLTMGLSAVVSRADNDWLAWPLDDLAFASQQAGIDPAEGLSFQVPFREGSPAPRWDKSFGFDLG